MFIFASAEKPVISGVRGNYTLNNRRSNLYHYFSAPRKSLLDAGFYHLCQCDFTIYNAKLRCIYMVYKDATRCKFSIFHQWVKTKITHYSEKCYIFAMECQAAIALLTGKTKGPGFILGLFCFYTL
jgi:hypothetical protein